MLVTALFVAIIEINGINVEYESGIVYKISTSNYLILILES